MHMNRHEAESLINSLYGGPSVDGNAQAVEATLAVLREMGLAAFSDEGIERLLDAEKEILAAEVQRQTPG